MPSSLLAVLCLAVVHRLQPGWVSITIAEAARSQGISAERISRLSSRAIGPFEALVAGWTRIGRPPRGGQDRTAQDSEQLALTRALLAVATSILAHVPRRSARVRSLIVGAWLRLRAEYPWLTQKQFCLTLSLSPRTLRSWINRLPETEATSALGPPAPPSRPPKRRPPQRRRFSFDVVLPETQLTADTSDLRAFGLPLKLIAAQDIGGRDRDLFESVIVDDHDSSELVVEVLTEAVHGREGLQVTVDQGTAYMAEATRCALERLGAEHAPQREGTPTDKSTIERAFRTIKDFARPLLELTDRIAEHLPSLQRPDLARALTTVVLTALLRSYQAGARAARRADGERAGLDPDTLVEVAAEARGQARIQDQSIRLRLEHIHRTYQLDGSISRFVRSYRRFPLPVIEQADLAFAAQAHRDDIARPTAYFGAIVRRLAEEFSARQAHRQREQQRDRQRHREIRELTAERNARLHNPVAGLRAALEILPEYWDQRCERLLFDGLGPGRSGARLAIERLTELHGPQAAADITSATLRDFSAAAAQQLPPAAIAAIDQLVRRLLPATPTDSTTASCAQPFLSAILPSVGRKQHPPPS